MIRYLPPIAIHWGKCAFDSNYRHKSRQLNRIKALPRFQRATTNVLGYPIELVDSASFIWMYDEIFDREIYRFRAKTERPYIIDCGANIGLSVLYFQRLYPKSRIVAFEPDERVFEVLRKNISSLADHNIDLQCRAVWTSDGSLGFMSEGADGGRLSGPGDSQDQAVKTVRLRDYLNEHVDFLKLDIEGAETEVLADCSDLLKNVHTLFVEFHSFANRPQRLDQLTAILAGAGYRMHIHPPITSPQPFLRRDVMGGMDMQLNIFAFRE